VRVAIWHLEAGTPDRPQNRFRARMLATSARSDGTN
jgi:hypothetical protein